MLAETKTTESNDTKLKKSSAVTTAKATESQNLESKTTETQMSESNVTKLKNKSTAGSKTVKTPSKKRVTKKQISTASRKRIKIDDATSVNVEATVVKDTSEFIFHFTAGNTPLQKLHQILNDPRVSPDNPKCSEIAHFVNEQPKSYGITYIEFLRHRNNEYMGCEVINGFMHLLREQFNNGGKNCFFPTQFFHTILDEKISRSKQGEELQLTNKDEWKNNWEELHFPINVHDNHWILILVDKPAKAVVVFDSIANINQYHVNKIFDLVKMMEDSTTTWLTINNSENLHIQRQKDRVNCGYFTCWYAR
jgi:Ulp1 family protease